MGRRHGQVEGHPEIERALLAARADRKHFRQWQKVHNVSVREREETFTLPAATKPLLVHFDEGDVPLKEVAFAKSTEDLLYQITHDNVIGRMEAVSALRPLDADTAVAEALHKAASGDPFWAVRCARFRAGGFHAALSGVRPMLSHVDTGFVANFFDTLDIGSFATTTAVFKFRNMVPDHLIPGALNAGHTLPTILHAFLYIIAIEMDAVTLVALIAGAWFGAAAVAALRLALAVGG